MILSYRAFPKAGALDFKKKLCYNLTVNLSNIVLPKARYSRFVFSVCGGEDNLFFGAACQKRRNLCAVLA